MNLLKRLRLGFKLAGELSDEERSTLSKIIPGGYKSTPYRGASGMLKAYSKSPWVRAVESKIGDAVGATKWVLLGLKNSSGKFVRSAALQSTNLNMKDYALGNIDVPGELVPIFDHPLLRLLNYSNPLFPGTVGRSQTQVSLDLTGEAFWLLGPESFDEGGSVVPERFWLLPSTWITGMPTVEDPYWEVQTPAWQGKFPEMAIMRFVTPDPVNPYGRGSGIFRAFGDEIDTDEFAAQHTKSFFLNDATPRLLISGEGLSEPDTKRMETTWLQSLRGFLKAHKPFFIARKIDVTQLSQKFSEMDLVPLRKWERDIIVHGIGVPPEMLGIVENSNRATINAADYLWAKWVISPRLDLQRAFMQQKLVPLYDARLILAYESPVQEDREYQLEVMKANPSVFKINDWKKQAGIEPTDDGEGYLIRFNEKVVETLEPTPALEPVRALPPGVAGVPPHERLTAGECNCGVSHSRDPNNRETAACALPRGFTRQVGGPDTTRLALRLSEQMQKEIIAAFKAMQNQVDMRALMAAFDSGNMNAAMQVLAEADLPAELEVARQTLREAIVTVGEASAVELGQFLGTNISFELTNPEAVAFLEEYGASMVKNVTDETLQAIRTLLEQAYRDGMTSREVAKMIEDIGGFGLTDRDIRQRQSLIETMREQGFTEAQINTEMDKWTKAKIKYRAQVIADNELVDAGNKGQRRLWDQALEDGLIDKTTKRQWIITPDEKLCVICGPMGDPVPGVSIVTMGEPYSTPVGPVYIPSDVHVRCRCSERILV